jgi:hypothetical protein
MDWDLIAAADAEAFRAHIVAREELRLVDLAHLLRDRGGPLDAMDGTRESIPVLWEWFADLTRAGFPGVPERKSALEAFWNFDLDPTNSRSEYAIEPIAHYLALVSRSFDDYAWATWPVERRARNHRAPQQQSTVLKAGHQMVDVLNVTWNFGNTHLFLGEEARLERESLLRAFDVSIGADAKVTRPALSLLPYADLPLVPLDDLRRDPPRLQHAPVEQENYSSEVSGFSLVLAKRDASMLVDYGELPSLPYPPVLRFLEQWRFRPSNNLIELSALGTDDAQLISENGIAHAELLTSGGVLRAVSIEPLNSTDTQWTQLELSFRELAAHVDGVVAEEA